MSAFDQLHPSIQHHVVNSLGWRSLRPLQEHSIEPVLGGKNCLLLAPTAGGKTEAAILPVLSRMLSEDWRGLTVLYVCPIRALLNNLEDRLSYYAGLVGRRCGLWHGDVAQAAKSRTLKDPPDILLTTPESLEALLISTRTDKKHFFGCLRTIVVDEIHAFAGDDRGWHLLAVLERIQRLAQMDVQRIGLSATVGNPDVLLRWLCGTSHREGLVVAAASPGVADADVMIDYVGSLQNAAEVLRLLHHGEKRLVFCDSRARTEELAVHLRAAGVKTYVSHSSLSVEQRRDAETAFREGRDCVIVATSTLELGIDVGDLDRVIQIDAPSTVSSFLQRLGRTGRRLKTKRNCLFLATTRSWLLQAAAIVELWQSGYVEPLEPPVKPYHLIAQQLLALILQDRGIGHRASRERLKPLLEQAAIPADLLEMIIAHMLSAEILADDSSLLGMGSEGERLYGAKNFMTLVSIFDTPPLFTVYWGPKDLGCVHPISFRGHNGHPAVLSLGGRSWQLTHIDWERKTAHVTPSEHPGRSRWLGESQPLRYELCQAVRRILLGRDESDAWSARTRTEIKQARNEATSVAPDSLVVERDPARERTTWWTFAGLFANSELARRLPAGARFDNFTVTVDKTVPPEQLSLRRRPIREAHSGTSSCDGMSAKFGECLPEQLLQDMQAARSLDSVGVARVEDQPLLIRDGSNPI